MNTTANIKKKFQLAQKRTKDNKDTYFGTAILHYELKNTISYFVAWEWNGVYAKKSVIFWMEIASWVLWEGTVISTCSFDCYDA